MSYSVCSCGRASGKEGEMPDLGDVKEERLAQIAYTAYAAAHQWTMWRGPMVRWVALNDEERQAWGETVVRVKLELEKEAEIARRNAEHGRTVSTR